MNRLLTVQEVAQWLGVAPRTVYAWVHEEYIPVIKLGTLNRFSESSISDWISRRETPGRASRRIRFDLPQTTPPTKRRD